MCNTGCDNELDQCLANCANWVPPTCTPGPIGNTWTTTDFVSSQFLGSSCLRSFSHPTFDSTHYRWKFNYKRTTWQRYRRADCTTYTSAISVSYYSSYCFQDILNICYIGIGYPSCVF